MLQQTTVTAVRSYYARFLARFPTITTLAAAPRDDVLALWAGLGYYSRARNLHACAQIVAARGGFPKTVGELRALPGIGEYTSRAVAAIAFNEPVVPVDGNVERVTARVFAIEEALPGARPAIARAAATLNTDPEAQARPSAFAQALFDLGATICTPRNPACGICPWQDGCAARKAGLAAELPRRAKRMAKPPRYGVCFVLRDQKGNFWLTRRPETGLLAGMTAFPGTPWRATRWTVEEAARHAPSTVDFELVGDVVHVFTHLTLHLSVYRGILNTFGQNSDGFACHPDNVMRQALPSVMRKCLRLAAPDLCKETEQ